MAKAAKGKWKGKKVMKSPRMEDFYLKTDYHPNRTLVALGFAVAPNYDCMLELFQLFGQVQLFYPLPHLEKRFFPSMAVVQYSCASEARCAIHALREYSHNRFIIKQPWAGTFLDNKPNRHLPIPRHQFIEEITKRVTLIVEKQRVDQLSIVDLEELKRFGIMSVRVHPNGQSSITEVTYRSPLSATLAMVGISNPWFELRLVRNVNEIRRYYGVFLDRYRHLNIIDNFRLEDIRALYRKLGGCFLKTSLFLNPVRRPPTNWQTPDALKSIITPVGQNNEVSVQAIVKVNKNQIQEAIRTGKVKDSGGIDLGLDSIMGKYLEMTMNFEVFYANILEEKAFILYLDESGRQQIDVSKTSKTGYTRWVSVFELMVSAMRQYDTDSKKWQFCVDAKVNPTNHLFKELAKDVFPNIDRGVLLANPINLTYSRRSVSEEEMTNGEEQVNNAVRGFPLKVRLEANLENVSSFRIPMIVYGKALFDIPKQAQWRNCGTSKQY